MIDTITLIGKHCCKVRNWKEECLDWEAETLQVLKETFSIPFFTFRASSGAAFRKTWCTLATETRTVRSIKWHATAASTAACRSALRLACPKRVRQLHQCYYNAKIGKKSCENNLAADVCVQPCVTTGTRRRRRWRKRWWCPRTTSWAENWRSWSTRSARLTRRRSHRCANWGNTPRWVQASQEDSTAPHCGQPEQLRQLQTAAPTACWPFRPAATRL